MKRLLTLLPVIFIASCGIEAVKTDPQVEYTRANVYKNLELPPDLITEKSSIFTIPGIDEFNSAAPDYKNATLVREAGKTWLKITGDTDLVWTRLHDFLNLRGIKVEKSDRLTGLITSTWLSNQDSIGYGDLLDNIQANFVNDNYLNQYLISIERMNSAQVKVIVIHNAMTKIDIKNDACANDISSQWIKAPANPAIELELLKKFMAYSGLSDQVGKQGFTQSNLSNLFKDKFLNKEDKDHYIIVKKPFNSVFDAIEKQSSDLFDVEEVQANATYIIINQPYHSVLLEKKTDADIEEEERDLVRIQVLKQGYSTKIVIRNDRGESIDLATTDKLLNKIMAINL